MKYTLLTLALLAASGQALANSPANSPASNSYYQPTTPTTAGSACQGSTCNPPPAPPALPPAVYVGSGQTVFFGTSTYLQGGDNYLILSVPGTSFVLTPAGIHINGVKVY